MIWLELGIGRGIGGGCWRIGCVLKRGGCVIGAVDDGSIGGLGILFGL